MNAPPVQRTPSNDVNPPDTSASLLMNTVKPDGVSPVATSVTVSGFVAPVAESEAPCGLNAFAQPPNALPCGIGTVFGATHGHAVASVPSAKQYGVPGPAQPCHFAIARDGVPPAIPN